MLSAARMKEAKVGIRSMPPITSTGRPSGKKFSSVDPVRFRTRGAGFSLNLGSASSNSSEQIFQPKKFQASKKSTPFVLEGMLSQTRSRLRETIKALKVDFSDSLLDEEVQLEHLIQQLKAQIIGRRRW